MKKKKKMKIVLKEFGKSVNMLHGLVFELLKADAAGIREKQACM